MNRIKVIVSEKPAEKYSGPLLVFLLAGDGKKQPISNGVIKDIAGKLFRLGDFSGKQGERSLLYPKEMSSLKDFQSKRLLLVGLGNLEKNHSSNGVKELLRCAGGTIAIAARETKARELLVVIPDYIKNNDGGAEQLIEGIFLGDYRFDKYKSKGEDDKKYQGIRKLTLQTKAKSLSVRKIVARAQHGAEAAITARNMANEPGNNWTPQHFADFARDLAESSSLKVKILEKNQIKRAGMGGIIAVNQGSSTPPKLIVLEHAPKKYSKTILLVGKGITFDSGGVSLKPAAGMQDMKYDMCGGAAVLSTMQAVTREKPGVRIVAIVPSTDNMSGASAIKPGDIIKHYNGVTSEIVNTDAEGRMILADALAYGIDKYKPDCAIDLATLTGAVIIGLGHHRTGLLSNSDTLADRVLAAGEVCGEPLWRLPLGKEYSKQIESEVADIKNVGGKAAGTITAAAYLQKFVGDTPWVHLDIAGTAWDYTKKNYIPGGPSGVGVRTLITFIREWKLLKL
jgi:leucyl aminopeptidase